MATHDIEKMWENLLKEDTGSRVQIIQEIHELILAGEIEVAKGMLRTLIKVTCGYPAISDEVGRNSKSIMRMLPPDVDRVSKRLWPLSELQNVSQKIMCMRRAA